MLNITFLTIMIVTLPLNLQASFAPWGKDEGISYASQEECNLTKRHSGHLVEPLIKFHQKVISEADGPRSHYYPSSSQYTLDALKSYGLVRGILMGCDRLTRENGEEWVYAKMTTKRGHVLKWDPVP